MAVNITKILSSVTCGNVDDDTESVVVHVRVDTHECREEDDAWVLASAFLECGDNHVCAQVQETTVFQYDASDLVAECDYECRFEVPSASWQKAMSDSGYPRLILVEYTNAGDVTDRQFVRDKAFLGECSWTLPEDTINVPRYIEVAVKQMTAELKSKK